jgi:hypothetical protein
MQQHGAEGEKSLAGSFFWNTLGGILNAGQSVLVLAVLTRVLGLAAAGIYSIAFATGNLFLYWGSTASETSRCRTFPSGIPSGTTWRNDISRWG